MALSWRPMHACTGGAIGVFLAIAAWEEAANHLIPLILPSPRAVLADAVTLLSDRAGWDAVFPTVYRAGIGFAVGFIAGTIVGVFAGSSRAFDKAVDPVVTLLMAVPPIAWVVLALIWFGITDGAAIFTVAVTVGPVMAVAARSGLAARDGGLDRMAELFVAPAWVRLVDVRMPQIVSHIAPAGITALALAMKVAVMVELLALADGLGAALARARVDLESTRAFAWIVIMLALVLGFERGVLRPLHRHLERWRNSQIPMAAGGHA